jgi:hypothetical protein
MEEALGAKQRHGIDRRRRPTPALSRYTFLRGRRRGSRRMADPQSVYVDQLGWGLASILVMIFVFHVLDAMFTLVHTARGGAELNPIMDFFLKQGSGMFLAVKLGTAGLGLLFLGVHGRFPWVRKGIAGLFVLYAGVVCYHVFLIWQSSIQIWPARG